VRLFIASTLQRIAVPRRFHALAARSEDAADPNLPLMIRYALERFVAAEPARAAALLKSSQIPFLRQAITRIAGKTPDEDDDGQRNP
jgi:hypothetical protein